jgi:hypothetical protein
MEPRLQSGRNLILGKRKCKMETNSVSLTFTTDKAKENRDFYVKYFDATVTPDCGMTKFNPDYKQDVMENKHENSIRKPSLPTKYLDEIANIPENFITDDSLVEGQKFLKCSFSPDKGGSCENERRIARGKPDHPLPDVGTQRCCG